MMSCASSIPAETRMNSGETPVSTCSSGVNCRMRRRCRMDHQGLCVADVRKVARELHVLDELLSGGFAALDPEPEDRPRTFREVALRRRVVRMTLEPRIVHPFDEIVTLQELRDRQGVLAVTRHPQMQRFQPLQWSGMRRRDSSPHPYRAASAFACA